MSTQRAAQGPLVERRIDLGAQVGIVRNRVFCSGGRFERLVTDPYKDWRPRLDQPSGNITFPRLLGAGQPTQR